MISAKLQEAINDQVAAEMYSANMYLAMSLECELKGFDGFAHWLKKQYGEEMDHAFKFMAYLLERGGAPELKTIEAPAKEYGAPLLTFEKVLAHECQITSLINKLYQTAVDEKDVAAQIFLQWYVTEQVEEEAGVSAILDKLRFIGDNKGLLLNLDIELATRVFVNPFPAATA